MKTSSHHLTSDLPKFPLKILTTTIIITIATLFWFSYFSFHTIHVFQNTVTRDFRAIELRGTIMQLDEVLTMSARLGVVTGDSQWEKRYNHYDPILVSAIDEAALIVPFSDIGESANKTNEANIKLVDMERKAFALSKEGKLAEAKQMIFGPAYDAQKKVYADGMGKYSSLLQERAESRLKSEITNTYYSLILIIIDIIASIIAWIVTFRSISHWRLALHNAMTKELKYKKEIEDARDLLEQRVKDRTAELESKNNELTTSKNELLVSNQKLQEEIIQREKAEEKAAELNSRLIIAAKRAGMSEIATSVLHNIGNVLNSAKTSIGLLQENAHKTDADDIATISNMLQENKDRLPTFLFDDPKGKLIPPYLMTIGKTLKDDHEINLHEVKSLLDHIKHIEDIVSMQQSISGVAGVAEKIYLPDVVDTAVQMCGDIFEKRNIKIHKDFKESPLIMTDKSKVLQIIVNLIQNAKDALISPEYDKPIKNIILKIEPSVDNPEKINIIVTDNGIGIKNENLVSIFSLGFTTKPTGHGFGLHSSALTAKELGGELHATSKGIGTGATFTFSIPIVNAKAKDKGRLSNDITA